MMGARAFQIAPRQQRHLYVGVGNACRRSLQAAAQQQDNTKLSVAEIKAALKERGIDYSDCFDKESLLCRLQLSSSKSSCHSSANDDSVTESTSSTSDPYSNTNVANDNQTSLPTTTTAETEKELLQELRSKSVKELRADLASRNLRWAGLLEKEDLVRAVYKAQQQAAAFSVTGKLTPGQVGALTGDELELEIQATGLAPLVCDVYATWCGPCQLKMDSDKYAEMSGKLRVQGLPTLILFRDGQQVDRVEGALMKDALVAWVKKAL
jgi:thiol-disulfide isomerase/thioredoxin